MSNLNLFQAMAILNEIRPDRPRSLDRKKLQQAIDAINEYVKNIPWEFSHRCGECKNRVPFVDIGERPYSSRTGFLCNANGNNWKDVSKDNISCKMFVPKEDNNEKNN